jgi:hypothetical protein
VVRKHQTRNLEISDSVLRLGRTFLPPSPRNAKHRHQLDAGIEASGPHGFAVAFENAFVVRIESVHRIPRPTFVTIAKGPSVQGRETARFMDVIWAK